MTMLRRYEIYSMDPNTPKEKIALMDASMRHAKRYIPEVLHSAVGYNKSEIGLSFVWEHAYESSAAYQRYMIHPFHANIYDRYLLWDSPERIVTDNDYDVGLLGYACETPVYLLPAGAARRVVLMRLAEGGADAFRAITESVKANNPKMINSVFAENTFGTRWLDGVTKIMEDTTYSHIWEQGFATLADAEAAGNAWRVTAKRLVTRYIELWYTLETGPEYL